MNVKKRKPIVASNWKMNKDFSQAIKDYLTISNSTKNIDDFEFLLATQDIFLEPLVNLKKENKSNVEIFAQNSHWKNKGSYTGETSPYALKSIGVDGVMLGHFERRSFFNETNDKVNLKAIKALKNGLKVILDIEEFEQLEPSLKNIDQELLKKLSVAFEPKFAIGSGNTANKTGIENVAELIRNQVKDLYGTEESENIRILYGGSVTKENVSEIMNQKNIDGVLVGSASLVPQNFIELIKNIKIY